MIGALAGQVNLGDGGSSDVYSLENVTVLDGLRAAASNAAVTFDDGTDPAAAAGAACDADVAIVVVGYTAEHEGEYIGDAGIDLSHLFPASDDPALVVAYEAEIAGLPPIVKPPHVPDRKDFGFARGGDRESVRLLPADVELIRAVAAGNPRTVVVLQAGSAVVCSDWDTDVAAIVQPFYGGEQAGHGLADVLFGEVNPSARLPFTVPASEDDLPTFDRDADRFTYDRWHGWWRAERLGLPPAYPFGFGLSYTTFELEDVEVRLDVDEIVATGSVANTGDADGADVVQFYVELPEDDAPRRLVGFGRVPVAAGATSPFEVRVSIEVLARRDPERHAWQRPGGRYVFTVARYVGDPSATSTSLDLG